MATSQIFVGTIKSPQGQVSAANANRDGTGTLVTLATAGASGARYDQLTIKATVTTTLGAVRIFRSTDGGTTKRLWREFIVAAITASATVPAFEQLLRDLGLVLAPAEVVYASTEKAEAINLVLSEGGDF